MDKNMKFKHIQVGEQVVGFVQKNAWSWTEAGVGMYSAEVRESAENFAELR